MKHGKSPRFARCLRLVQLALVAWACAPTFAEEKGKGGNPPAASKAEDAAEPAPLLRFDFAEASPGAVPEGIFVMEGEWRLAEADGQVALELAPLPLVEGHLQFGENLRQSGARLRAEVEAARAGRRHSQAEIGLHGVSGYRLRLHRAGRRLELVKAWQVVAEAPLPEVGPDQWVLELEVRPAPAADPADPADEAEPSEAVAGDLGWEVLARAWPASEERPAAPQLRFQGPPEPLSGRASLRAAPFSGKPVRYLEIEIWE